MSYGTLITAEQLAERLDDPDVAVFDCRFSLSDTERGRRDYEAAHIPGAVHAHLDVDLSGPVIRGRTGRHPLPTVEAFARTLSAWGIDDAVQVVAYDDMGGAIAARLWWMLHWLGHEATAVLDGGWPVWLAQERPTRAGVESRGARTFVPHPRPDRIVGIAEVEALSRDGSRRLVDSRASERYRGEVEPIDPVAGHIPGAVNLPHTQTAGADGRFLSPEELAGRFRSALGDVRPDDVVFYCGSGVTAARNILAFAHAGLGEARLYPGSWSEWITDSNRPIAGS